MIHGCTKPGMIFEYYNIVYCDIYIIRVLLSTPENFFLWRTTDIIHFILFWFIQQDWFIYFCLLLRSIVYFFSETAIIIIIIIVIITIIIIIIIINNNNYNINTNNNSSTNSNSNCNSNTVSCRRGYIESISNEDMVW